jgi:hypothetical protein
MEDDLLTSAVIPQFFPAHWLQDAPDIVHTAFPSRIRIGYVIRREGGYAYVMQGELEAAGLSLAHLHEAAVENLRALPCPDLNVAQTPGGPEAWLGDAADNFNAARLLMPALQGMLAADLGEPFYAVLPCRDWFTCWSRKQSPEWQTKNKAEAVETFLGDKYNLTPDVFVFEGGRFRMGEVQEVP